MFNNNTQCQLVKLLDFNALLLLFSQVSQQQKEQQLYTPKKKGTSKKSFSS